MLQLRRMLPAEGWLTERMSRLRERAQHARAGHLHRIEELRAGIEKLSPEAQQKAAHELQAEAFQSVPYVPTGQFIIPSAYRKNLKGVIVAPVAFLWNIEKD